MRCVFQDRPQSGKELVWQCSMAVFCPFSSHRALLSILWDMVLVNTIIRSGLPSFFFSPPRGFVNTFA